MSEDAMNKLLAVGKDQPKLPKSVKRPRELVDELRRSMVRDALAMGISSPSVIANSLDEPVSMIRSDIKYILENEFTPIIQDLDLQDFADKSLRIYDTIVKEAWEEYQTMKRENVTDPKSTKLLMDTIMAATEHKEKLLTRLGILGKESAGDTYNMFNLSQCQDCEYMKQSLKCPMCREYHAKRLEEEGKTISVEAYKVVDEDEKSEDQSENEERGSDSAVSE